MSEAMSGIKVYDNGYEGWVKGKLYHDPWMIREVIIEAPAETPRYKLEEIAESYLKAHVPQQEVTRTWEDEEADEHGPAQRVLRVFIE